MLVRLMPPKARGIVMNLTNHLHGDGEDLASIGKKKTINSLGVELHLERGLIEVLDIEIISFHTSFSPSLFYNDTKGSWQ